MQAKFRIGDKVRLNKRTPDYIRKSLRQRTRTVVEVFYCQVCQADHIILGDRGKTPFWYQFRSYMLDKAPDKPTMGRPRIHRKNGLRSKLPFEPSNQKPDGGSIKAIPHHFETPKTHPDFEISFAGVI